MTPRDLTLKRINVSHHQCQRKCYSDKTWIMGIDNSHQEERKFVLHSHEFSLLLLYLSFSLTIQVPQKLKFENYELSNYLSMNIFYLKKSEKAFT